MPVAALIVVGPGIEVKAVKSDPLGADWNHGKQRTDVTIKAILSIPRYDGASRKRIKRGKNANTSVGRLARLKRARSERAYTIIDDLVEPVVPVVQGQVVTYGNYPLR